MDRQIEVTTVRTIDDQGVMHNECNDGRTCVGLHTIVDRPGRSYLVIRAVDDPDEAAALARFAKPGEIIGWVPDELITGGA